MTTTPIPRSRSLRWTVLPQLAIVTALVIGGGLGFAWALSVQQHDEDLAKRARTIADFIIYAAETSPSLADLQRFVAASGGSHDVNLIAVAVGTPARIVAASRHTLIDQPFASLPGVTPIPPGSDFVLQPPGARLRYMASFQTGLEAQVPGQLQAGTVLLELDNHYAAESRNLILIFGPLLGLCVVAIAAGAWFLIRIHVLAPLARLRDAMRFRARGDTNAFVASRTPGEIGDLSRTYDNMLLTLQARERALAASESAERAARTNFNAFFDFSVDCLCVLDMNGAFIAANATLLNRLGYSLEELRGQSVLTIHPQSHHEEAGRIMRDILAGRTDKCPVPLQAKDGRLIPVESRVVPGTWDGQSALFGISRDIADRQRYEQALLDHKADLERQVAERTAALIQAQKMESIGRLAGGIAHDFNNCLYCIQGFSEMLLETLPAEFPHRDYVQEILRATQQAADVTRQLLAFSRRQFIQPTRADINALVTHQQKMLRRLIGEDIRIGLDLQPGETPAVVDPSQFQQVLMNLCVNARDAMHSCGVLTIGTRVLRVTPPGGAGDATPGDYVRVSVTDTGCGMSPETLAHIFEPFFTTKAEGKGTGLGLPVVHGIVQQHGGWIDVTSTLGAGARFDIFFPAADRAESAPPPPPPPAGAPRGKCVLLVEDDREVRTLAAIRLRAMGHRVIAAESVSEGLRAFREVGGQIEILLSDVVLPDGTGVALAETIAAEAPAVRIMFSSGYADERSRIQEIHARGWAFITKPYTREALAALLRGTDVPPTPAPPPGPSEGG